MILNSRNPNRLHRCSPVWSRECALYKFRNQNNQYWYQLA
jgi:hypothetical protein